MSDRRYQMTCPKCHYEFTYDNGYLDKNITRLGHEIQEINLQLTKVKALPYAERKKHEEWRKRAVITVSEKQKEISELKAIRKVADQQIKSYEYQIFKTIVKEYVGEAKYRELIAKVEEDLEAYKVSGLARHEYTRSNSKSSVTNINKL